MPIMTVTISAANFTRIITALDREWEREEGETDGVFAKRWLKGRIVELVYGGERQAAAGAVVADNTLVEIT